MFCYRFMDEQSVELLNHISFSDVESEPTTGIFIQHKETPQTCSNQQYTAVRNLLTEP